MFYAGVDVGGSGTRAELCSGSRRLGEGRAGSGNLGTVGHTGSLRVVVEAVAAAFRAAGLEPSLRETRVHAGIAGLGRLEDCALLLALPHPFRRLTVESDAHLTLRAAYPSGEGTILLCGTGALALRRIAAGQEVRAGGWGFPLERGGGAWLGMEGLRLGLEAIESGQHTALATAMQRRFLGIDGAIRWTRTAKASSYAGLVPDVLAAAKQGDQEAARLLTSWSSELMGLLGRINAMQGPWTVWGGLSRAVLDYAPPEWLERYQPMAERPLGAALKTAQLPH
ncbi:hypothetical protein DEFR109230_01045 [Deinococcus frigens]